MPAIGEFIVRYPQIEPDLDFTDRLVEIIDEGFDAVIRSGEANDSRLMTRAIGTFQQCLVAAPAYLRSRGVPMAASDLLHHPCLHHKFPSTGELERWPLQDCGKSVDIELPTTAVASTLEPLLSLAERGAGIACPPDSP